MNPPARRSKTETQQAEALRGHFSCVVHINLRSASGPIMSEAQLTKVSSGRDKGEMDELKVRICGRSPGVATLLSNRWSTSLIATKCMPSCDRAKKLANSDRSSVDAFDLPRRSESPFESEQGSALNTYIQPQHRPPALQCSAFSSSRVLVVVRSLFCSKVPTPWMFLCCCSKLKRRAGSMQNEHIHDRSLYVCEVHTYKHPFRQDCRFARTAHLVHTPSGELQHFLFTFHTAVIVHTPPRPSPAHLQRRNSF